MFSSTRVTQDEVVERPLIGQPTSGGQGPSRSTRPSIVAPHNYVWVPDQDYPTILGSYKQKEMSARPLSGPLTTRERLALRYYDVNDREKFLSQRIKQLGATTVRDALGFGFRLEPNQAFRRTAGIDKTPDIDSNSRKMLEYGNHFEPIAKRYHQAKLSIEVEYAGFRANPAYNSTEMQRQSYLNIDEELQKDLWFAEHWPFLSENARNDVDGDLSNVDYLQKRDNIINAHWLVTSPDAMLNTRCLYEKAFIPNSNEAKLQDIHNPEVFDYQGICEVKSKINQFSRLPDYREAYVIQMAAQALCCMENQEYEGGSLIPWGHLIMFWAKTPLTNVTKSTYEPDKVSITQSWFLPFTNPNFFFDMMEDMRRFKEALDDSWRELRVVDEEFRSQISTVEFTVPPERRQLYTDYAREVLIQAQSLYRDTPNKFFLKDLEKLGDFTAC